MPNNAITLAEIPENHKMAFAREYTYKEFADYLQITYEALKKMIIRGKLPDGCKVITINKRVKKIRVDLSNSYEQKHETTVEVSKLSFAEEERKRVEWARRELLAIWNKKCSMHSTKNAATEQLLLEYNQLHYYPDLLVILGPHISQSTLYHWANQSDLRPNYKFAVDGANITEFEKKTLLTLYLKPTRPKYAEVIRRAIEVFKATPKRNFEIKSVKTYSRFLKRYEIENANVVTGIRHTMKRVKDTIIPDIKRDYSLIEVGDIVVLDGHTLNYSLRDANGKLKRLTLIAVIDFKSGVPLGYEIMQSENGYAIKSAVRSAIETLGFKPRTILLDNGRANKSLAFQKVLKYGTQNKGAFQDLGITPIFAKPYNAKTKPVESFFEKMGEHERNMPSFVGDSIANQPAHLFRAEEVHTKVFFDTINKNPGIVGVKYAMRELMDWSAQYVEYVHQSGQMKGYSRREIYNNSIEKVLMQDDFAYRKLTADQLEDWYMVKEIKKLGRNGISLLGEDYWSPELGKLSKEYGAVHFKVRYDVANLSQIKVYDKNGFYCIATMRGYHHPAAAQLGTREQNKKLHDAWDEKYKFMEMTQAQVKEALELNAEEIVKQFQYKMTPINVNESLELMNVKELEKEKKRPKERVKFETSDDFESYDWASEAKRMVQ